MKPYSLVSDKYYELLEVHRLPRGLFGITIIVIKPTVEIVYDGINCIKFNVNINYVGFVISNTETLPSFATFYPPTKSLTNIHKRVDFIKETLKNPNVEIKLHNKKYIYINKV